MARYTFTMDTEDEHEMASFVRKAFALTAISAQAVPAIEPEAKADAPVEPKTRKARESKKVEEVGGDTPETKTEAPADEKTDDSHPLLKDADKPEVEITLADVKAKGSATITRLGNAQGPVKVSEALKKNFGVATFGGIAPADFAKAIDVMDAL